MDQKPDLIKEDIAETRTALTGKLEALEDNLRDKVDSAKTSVEETIENVRSKVRKFSPSHQLQQHPFVAIGAAAGVGYIVGRKVKPRISGSRYEGLSASYYERPATAAIPPAPQASQYEAPEYEGSWTGSHELQSRARTSGVAEKTSRLRAQVKEKGGQLFEKIREDFSDEIGMLKGMAFAAALGVAREFTRSALPQKIGQEVERVWDSALSKVSPQGDQPEREYRAETRG